jgi:ABC-type multidrug transport system ATPase subunit
VKARADFLELLPELKQAGKTLLFSSHRLDEVMALADRVLVLSDGQLMADCPPSQLGQQLGWETTLHLFMPAEGVEPAVAALTCYGLPVSRNGRGIRVQVEAGQKVEPLRVLHDAGIPVDDFELDS